MKLGDLIAEKRKLVVLPKLAELIGLNNAIFLQQIQFFNQDKDIDNDWFVCNVKELQKKYFSFWSVRTIERIKKILVAKELLETKKSNKNRGDHTLSYRVNKEKILQEIQSKENYSVSENKKDDKPAPSAHAGLSSDDLSGGEMPQGTDPIPLTIVPDTSTGGVGDPSQAIKEIAEIEKKANDKTELMKKILVSAMNGFDEKKTNFDEGVERLKQKKDFAEYLQKLKMGVQ